MTPKSPTWADIEAFLAADGWRRIRSGERGGSQSDHVFYEKALPDGRVLQTHVSHSRKKTVSAGRFGAILRHKLEVSRAEFWACIGSGRPVDRPVESLEPAAFQHPAWVISVLVGRLHLAPEEVAAMPPDEAAQRARDFFAGPGAAGG